MKHLVSLAVCVALVPLAVGAAAGTDAVTVIRGHRLPSARFARVVAPAERAPARAIAVALRWQREAELEELIRQLSDPGSPRYQRYLTPAEFDERFAPSAAGAAAVVDYLAAHGIAVAGISASQQLVSGSAPAAAIESAFSVALVDYEEGGESFFASDRDPALPAEIAAAVSGIYGLENRSQLRPHNARRMLSAPTGAPFGPADIARAYNFTPLYDAGVRGDGSRAATIAIATAFGLQPSDVREFWRAFGLTRPADLLEVIPVAGTATRTIDESTLDVEWAGAMAPQSRLLAYVAADSSVSAFMALYDRIISDNRAAVVSVSWGLCEPNMPPAYLDHAHAVFQKAAALGITVVAASGDRGAFDCGPARLSISYPASDPLVTAVGGTALAVGGDGERRSEGAWSGSGGGQSVFWQRPPWQTGGGAWRRAADVALNADPGSGYYVRHDGAWWQYGGTSVGAPIWAALLALTNQYRAQHRRPPLGPANPALCELAGAAEPPALLDITSGDNGHYSAGAGWDFPTGWGVPDAWALARALASAPPAAGWADLRTYLRPLSASPAATVLLRSQTHCGRSRLTLAARRLRPGLYRLAIDETPVIEFAVQSSGRAQAQLDGCDPRGHHLTLLDADGLVLFRGQVPEQPQPPVRLRARLQGAGLATGVVTYRSRHGAEQLQLGVSGLPPGTYQLYVGAELIASLEVTRAANGNSYGAVRFDSRNLSAPPPPVELRCQPLFVRGDSGVVLQLTATAPGTGICPA
ncbi:MAG: S8/S53 family peptidase [Deltaproteobacteria bacterium]|nr:S8/S53 family peptidase [Deltaproteobacteria bacterium]